VGRRRKHPSEAEDTLFQLPGGGGEARFLGEEDHHTNHRGDTKGAQNLRLKGEGSAAKKKKKKRDSINRKSRRGRMGFLTKKEERVLRAN